MSASEQSESGVWLSTLDPISGRTYYYNRETKETTWTKPVELASVLEKESIVRKKRETKRFFKDMEANIINKLKKVWIISDCDTVPESDPQPWIEMDDRRSDSPSNGSRHASQAAYQRVRTISSLDDEILSIMASSRRLRQGSRTSDSKATLTSYRERERTSSISTCTCARCARGGIGMPSAECCDFQHNGMANWTGSRDANDFCLKNAVSSTGSNGLEVKDDLDTTKAIRRTKSFRNCCIENSTHTSSPGMKRRNSTGTIYLGTTMSTQDNQATIQCVCAVIHMHLIEAAREGRTPHRDFKLFEERIDRDRDRDGNSSYSHSNSNSNDYRGNGNHSGSNNSNNNNNGNGNGNGNGNMNGNQYNQYTRNNYDDKIPSVGTIRDFFLLIFSKSQLESECIIMSLIYIERLMKETRGKLCICPSNWKAILFACLVMASKVWDDLSMWNVDFSHVCPTFDLQHVNALELSMLEALKYLIKVSAGEYAKYYFHLRSMMSKLGLQENEPAMLAPLDIKGARRLQLVTENYQEKKLQVTGPGSRTGTPGNKAKNRARSYTIVSGAGLDKMKHRLQSQDAYEQSPVGVGLEQLVHSVHVDADGRQHATPAVAKYRSLREFNSNGSSCSPSPPSNGTSTPVDNCST